MSRISFTVYIIQEAFYSVRVGDVVTFGTFEQDNDTSNGTEPIEWIVLAKDNKKVFLLSKYGLDYRQFFGKGSFDDWTWECSSLRKWLNKTFYKKAFSTEEKSLILKTKLENKPSPIYHCDGVDTIDRIFILTCEDIVSQEYRLIENGYSTCTGTRYAYRKNKVLKSKVENGDSNASWYWWTRTPDENVACYYVETSSGGTYMPNRDGDEEALVRPALYVSLK